MGYNRVQSRIEVKVWAGFRQGFWQGLGKSSEKGSGKD